MLPSQNSRPRHSSQFQKTGISPSRPPQAMGNPGNFMPNPMQIQAHMGVPSNTSNTQFAPGQVFPFQMNQMNNSQQKGQFFGQNVVNPPQFLNNQNVGFGVLPNPLQNMNQFQLMQLQQMAMMASLALPPGNVPLFQNQGMGLQNPAFPMNGPLGLANANANFQQMMNANFPKQMANANQQLQGQSPQNSAFPMNAPLGLANANTNFQQMANVNQQLQGQMAFAAAQQLQGQSPHMNSFFGIGQQPQSQNFNAPASANTQVSQGMAPQNSNFAMNAHLGLVNANGAVQQSMNGLSNQMPNATQQLQGQLPLMNAFGFVQQPQAQNFNAPPAANTQVNPGSVAGLNNSKGNRKNSYNSNFSRNQKPCAKSKKSQFGKRKFSVLDTIQEEVHHRNGGERVVPANSVKPDMEKKRSLVIPYSEQEIQRWREERRKNFPSKANVEKKLTPKMAESEDSSRAAKLRRQQLKEILAKQAELGCEVAEIPSSYLSDSERQVDERSQRRPLSRKERFQNKFNKRERFKRKDRFSKNRRFGDSDSSNTRYHKGSPAGKVEREPTLLQKLLSSDIRRDKRHLLQVFRFMTMNSFFKDWPEKPLRFPRVVLKETGNQIEATEEKYDAVDATIEQSSNDSDNDDENNNAEFSDEVSDLQENCTTESEEPQEEQQFTE